MQLRPRFGHAPQAAAPPLPLRLPCPQAFVVTQAEVDAFERQHPAPERPTVDKPSPPKTAAGGGSGGRPAKRARAAAGGENEALQEEEEQEQGQQQQQGAGLTEMERQRLELIQRNREVRRRP